MGLRDGEGEEREPHDAVSYVRHLAAAEDDDQNVEGRKTESISVENGEEKVDPKRLEKFQVSEDVAEERADSGGACSPPPPLDTAISHILEPESKLPRPEAPRGIIHQSKSPEKINSSDNFVIPSIGKFIRAKSRSLTSAISKRFFEDEDMNNKSNSNYNFGSSDDSDYYDKVTEFNLSGLKVTVNSCLPGRVSFFSRSNCRDCTAVRSFLRERKLNYVEINVDVYPMRVKELLERTGSATVPQVFFNENLIGGLVALNSLRKSGLLEKKLNDMLSTKCPVDAPAPAVYGIDDDGSDEGNQSTDEMVGVLTILRQRLPIQDRLMKMKIVKNCFSGEDLVEVLIHHLDCGRKKAVAIGKELARKHFIHHVFRENEFEDGKFYYRFLEHEPYIPNCYNFWGLVNDLEPKAATFLGQRLSKIMSAILESYASDDRRHLDYVAISNSEEFRRYINLVQDLQRVDLSTLSEDEKLAFYLNLYNAMVIHAVIRIGHPGGLIEKRMTFFSDFKYIVGGHPYSLSTIKNGILRNNRRAPFSLVRPLGSGDRRLELVFPKVNVLIHFALCQATISSPAVKFFTPQNVESELRYAAREFFKREDGLRFDLSKRTVYLSRIIKWYSIDFGRESEVLKWLIKYLDATKSGLLTHLLGDGGPIHIVYQNFDWSLNS